ncbi:Variant surface glycoprotein [Trypanosoma congolense IL3000]|uniref:Variant surface glycoprotein n=1 Tax=Trypanosoma congolense (strain IL3000) TaxID=1068625 RepID=F9W9C2_TRYCI|nr:Variant surface glycoprotein [Trypanosoma congolense IL3000]
MTLKNGAVLEILSLFCLVHAAASKMKEGSNAKQYGILCDIYNVAANPPTSLYDTNYIEKIRSEIDIINASLSDDSSFSETADSEFHQNMSMGLKEQTKERASLLTRWMIAVASVDTNSTGFKKLTSTNLFVKRAQMKLIKIVKQAEKIIKSIEAEGSATFLEEIKKDFGDAVGEIGDQTKKADRATECGPGNLSGPGSKAGKFLIMDFLCLCSKPCISDYLPSVCGPDLKDIRWDKTSRSGEGKSDEKGEKTWKILQEGCESRPKPTRADPVAGYAALGEFLTAISQDAGISDKNKTGLLGSIQKDRGTNVVAGGCSGRNKAGHGTCLFYGDGWRDGGNNIPWVQKFRSGLKKLERIQKRDAFIQRLIGHLEMIQIRAEEIYEDAKMTLDYEDTEKTTQSHCRHTRFFLPWVLLL